MNQMEEENKRILNSLDEKESIIRELNSKIENLVGQKDEDKQSTAEIYDNTYNPSVELSPTDCDNTLEKVLNEEDKREYNKSKTCESFSKNSYGSQDDENENEDCRNSQNQVAFVKEIEMSKTGSFPDTVPNKGKTKSEQLREFIEKLDHDIGDLQMNIHSVIISQKEKQKIEYK